MSELAALDCATTRELCARRELSPSEAVAAALARAEARDELGAFLALEAESALARAQELEEAQAKRAEPGPLFGVPIGIKDNLALEGWPLTCASRILEGHRAAYTATAISRVLAAGAIPIGRCNMDEFAFGSSNEHSAYGPARNPWDETRVPGGSSGGSAVAVAAGIVPLALGSDTGGSVRQPASLCGVSGLKPSYGRVSRFGLVAFGSSLDCIGPIAHSAADCELALGVLAGHDPLDATSRSRAAYAPDEPLADLRGLRLGLPAEFFGEGVVPEIAQRLREAAATLEGLGAELVELSIPSLGEALEIYYFVASAEAASNLARFDGLRYGRPVEAASLSEHYLATRGQGLGDEAKRRILCGNFGLSAGYQDRYARKANALRAGLRAELAQAFARVDLCLGPTSPIPAFALGEAVDDPLSLWRCDACTAPANLAGGPAISLPCGFDAAGLPVGLQLMGPEFGEARLLACAKLWQEATTFHRATPGAA